MTFSLYDAVIPSNLQILGSVEGLVDKAEAYAAEKHMAAADMIEARLTADMLPFGFQVKSSVEHSRALVQEGMATLKALDRDAFDSLTAGDCEFRMRDFVLPFGGATFLLSFSQPNFYFHATTAYAILRAKGVKLGKQDFLGQLRVKR